MSQSLHVCKICGKRFATTKAVCGHQRIHSELKRVWGVKKPRVSTSIGSKALDPTSLSLKESSSFMTDIEKHEMNDAAMSLVMFSERVSVITNLPPAPGDVAMDLDKIIHCAESKPEVFSTCSDVVAQALPSPLISSKSSQIKRESNFSYRFKICGKSFERSLGAHRSSSNRGCEKEEFEAGFHSPSLLTDSGAKEKVVPQPSSSCFEVSQEELRKRRDANVKEQSVELRQDFSKASFDKATSSYSDVIAQEALTFPLRSNFQERPQSNSSYKCKVCGKSLGCFQALGCHQTLHRPISVILGRKRKRFEDGNSPSGSSEAKEIVPQPSSIEVSQEELIERRDTNLKEHFVELKQDSERFSSCSDVFAQALPSPLGCNIQKRLESNSRYERGLKTL